MSFEHEGTMTRCQGDAAWTLGPCQDVDCGQTSEMQFSIDREHWITMRANKALKQIKVIIKVRSNPPVFRAFIPRHIKDPLR